jgi:hypothetical protein
MTLTISKAIFQIQILRWKATNLAMRRGIITDFPGKFNVPVVLVNYSTIIIEK